MRKDNELYEYYKQRYIAELDQVKMPEALNDQIYDQMKQYQQTHGTSSQQPSANPAQATSTITAVTTVVAPKLVLTICAIVAGVIGVGYVAHLLLSGGDVYQIESPYESNTDLLEIPTDHEIMETDQTDQPTTDQPTEDQVADDEDEAENVEELNIGNGGNGNEDEPEANQPPPLDQENPSNPERPPSDQGNNPAPTPPPDPDDEVVVTPSGLRVIIRYQDD